MIHRHISGEECFARTTARWVLRDGANGADGKCLNVHASRFGPQTPLQSNEAWAAVQNGPFLWLAGPTLVLPRTPRRVHAVEEGGYMYCGCLGNTGARARPG